MQGGEVLLLENVRFHQGEQGDAAQLSAYSKAIVDALAAKGGPVSVYVNDAFGTAHRAHASVVGVPALVQGPKVAGLLMAKEVKYLDGVFASSTASSSPGGGAGTRKGVAAVIGGAKLKSKLPVFEHLLNKVDALVVGGAMALPFLRAQGYQTGVTPDGAEAEASAKQIIEKSTAKVRPLLPHFPQLPIDLFSSFLAPQNLTSSSFASRPHVLHPAGRGPRAPRRRRHRLLARGEARDCHRGGHRRHSQGQARRRHRPGGRSAHSHAVTAGGAGRRPSSPCFLLSFSPPRPPQTSKLIRDVLAPCGTVIWNGPMGVIENPKFAEGTYALIKTISALEGATTVAGGGETSTAIEALKKVCMPCRFVGILQISS